MKFLKEKGITLIALIVTIIVLLILAGISIGTISGKNGIIDKAQTAKDDTQRSQWEEQIDVAIIDAESKNRKPSMNDVIEELKNKNIINDASQVNEQTGTITTNKPVYDIEGKLDDYLGITAEMIADDENKDKYYGAIIDNYTCQNSEGVNNWKIFYADKNNIYIIADDYIPYEYIPTNSQGHKPSQSTYHTREGYFKDILGDYTGSDNITDERIKALNNDYFNTKGYSSNNGNMKVVAYLLDIDAWSVFAGEDAEYAIGGPTIEILMKSYSEKYKVDYRAQASSAIGYQISNDGGNSWEDSISDILNTVDSLYVKKLDYASGMCLSSPSFHTTSNIFNTDYNGNIMTSVATIVNVFGFRPLVCLNSNVKLLKKEEGIYSIK